MNSLDIFNMCIETIVGCYFLANLSQMDFVCEASWRVGGQKVCVCVCNFHLTEVLLKLFEAKAYEIHSIDRASVPGEKVQCMVMVVYGRSIPSGVEI